MTDPRTDDEHLLVLLADVEQKAAQMRRNWAGMDPLTRRGAVDELHCRAGEFDRAAIASPDVADCDDEDDEDPAVRIEDVPVAGGAL